MSDSEQSKLKKLRIELGLSIVDVSKLSGTPYTTWIGWETAPGKVNSRRPPKIAFSWLDLYKKLKWPNTQKDLDL